MQLLSSTTGYAILALAYVGGRNTPWVQVKEIASETGLPQPYLAKILHLLGRAKLVRTKRGYRGGVALSRPAADLTLLEVATAVAPVEVSPDCILGFQSCSDTSPCIMHDFWRGVRQELQRRLAQLTLQDVATHRGRRGLGLPTPRQVQRQFEQPGGLPTYRGSKPTGRFLRKFQ
jgi:Rrf2 family protein